VTLTRKFIRLGAAARAAPNLKLRRPELLMHKLRALQLMTGLLHQQIVGLLPRQHQIPGLYPHRQMIGGLHLPGMTALQLLKARRMAMIAS
jgi:hypothetical protein